MQTGKPSRCKKHIPRSTLPSEATHGQASVYAERRCAVIFKACRRDHIQLLLRRLHWLRMPERISFRLAVLVYRCLHGSAPGYLASDLQRVSHLNARRRLRSSTIHQRWSLHAQCVLPLATCLARDIWRGAFSCVRWQITPGDPIWQVTFRSSAMGFA